MNKKSSPQKSLLSEKDLISLEHREYPCPLDLRVIALKAFDAVNFIENLSFKVLSQSQAESKNQKYLTTRLTVEFSSFEDYVSLRAKLQKQALVQFVL